MARRLNPKNNPNPSDDKTSDAQQADDKIAESSLQKVERGPWGWYWSAAKRWGRVSGRACRREYAWFMILTFMLWLAVFLTVSVLVQTDLESGDGRFVNLPRIVGYVCAVVFVPGMISTVVRRLHDVGLSGWFFIVLAAVQYVLLAFGLKTLSGIVPLCLVFWPGRRGENAYGPDPRFVIPTIEPVVRKGRKR